MSLELLLIAITGLAISCFVFGYRVRHKKMRYPRCKYCGNEMKGIEGMAIYDINPTVCYDCLEKREDKEKK